MQKFEQDYVLCPEFHTPSRFFFGLCSELVCMLLIAWSLIVYGVDVDFVKHWTALTGIADFLWTYHLSVIGLLYSTVHWDYLKTACEYWRYFLLFSLVYGNMHYRHVDRGVVRFSSILSHADLLLQFYFKLLVQFIYVTTRCFIKRDPFWFFP